MRLKYIITTDHTPIVFTEGAAHNEVAHGLSLRSAGYVNIGYDSKENRTTAHCFGQSVTLKDVMCLPEEDSRSIERMFNYY